MDLSAILLDPPPGGANAALLIGRLAIGICFIVHALGKVGVIGNGSMEGFTKWLEALGVPYAAMQARMAMISELAGGACLALGLLTRPACIVLMGTMVVAGVIGHRGAGYLITNDPPGAEYTINLAVICLMFALLGPGAYSVDALLFG